MLYPVPLLVLLGDQFDELGGGKGEDAVHQVRGSPSLGEDCIPVVHGGPDNVLVGQSRDGIGS